MNLNNQNNLTDNNDIVFEDRSIFSQDILMSGDYRTNLEHNLGPKISMNYFELNEYNVNNELAVLGVNVILYGVCEEKVVGYLRGYILEPLVPHFSIDAQDFIDNCDKNDIYLLNFTQQINCDEKLMSSILEQGGEPDIRIPKFNDYFSSGALFYLDNMEISETHWRQGYGTSLLSETMKHLGRRHLNLGKIALDLRFRPGTTGILDYSPFRTGWNNFDEDNKRLNSLFKKVNPLQYCMFCDEKENYDYDIKLDELNLIPR